MVKKLSILVALFLSPFCFRAQPGTSWSLSGPIQFPTNASGQINGIGRCTQLKFDPTNLSHLYMTSASGGLWMSSDTGKTWNNGGTDLLPYMQCASICIDHTSNNTLYLGTGDPNYYSGGYGVYKSTNGGVTWTSSGSGISTGLVVEIIMDPSSNQNLVAATDNGIFKSTNAGSSWTNVKTGGDFKAMVLKPNSKDTMYAVNSSEIWRSLDFGSTWQQITNGVTIPGGNGQGMRLAVSKASPNVVYAGMIADGGTILKSTDFGTSFTTVYHNPSQSLVGYDAVTPGQGDYNFAMTADPTNASTVYVAAHCVWKSTDGGVTWSKLTNWYAGCHTDMHGIALHPVYPGMLFDANDGGLFLSRDGGTNWEPRADGVAASEVYHAAQSNSLRSMVSIGTQDNGELYSLSNTWYTNRGGDWGSKVKFSYNAPDVAYYFQNGNRRPVSGSETSYSLPFAASDNICLEFNRKLPNMALSALQNIFICTAITTPTPSWTQVGTTSNTVVALHSSLADSSMVYAVTANSLLYRCDNVLAASPSFTSYITPAATNVAASITTIRNNVNVVYLSCGTRVYRSANKGQSFTNISTGLPAGVNIIKIIHDDYSSNESVYLCTAKGVYYRNSGMSSWQNISYNLPTIADIQELMIYNPGNASSLLRIAYYGRGVWELPINTSMPPAPAFVADQQIVCANTVIHFTDQSIGTPAATSWQWSFPGGTPSTSTSQNPAVTYTSPGSYQVTLVVGNTNGTNSLTKTAYIQVTSPQPLPISEGFAGAYPPAGWTLYDAGNDNVVWQQSLSVGGYGTSSECTFFDNYNVDAGLKHDELRTKNYNFNGLVNPVMLFDVAYARWGSSNYDSLEVLASTDCGQTYSSIYSKGGSTLATAPDDQNLFVPTATQWRTETIGLGAYAGQPQVMFAFRNRGHYGNVIYVDNINLSSTTSVLKMEGGIFSAAAYPNPAHDQVDISITSGTDESCTISLTDQLGRQVYQKETTFSPGTSVQPLDVSHLAKGLYILSIQSSKHTVSEKLFVE